MVKLIQDTEELIKLRTSITEHVGFVPTMGNLHAGHISLLEKALEEYQVVFFSIFVNPKQFGPSEDFNRYPRTLEDDLSKIKACVETKSGKTVYVYAPQDPKQVFPVGDNRSLSVLGLSTMLEGALRPGHFDGVATVVYRLFELVKPTRAYFGLKDYQQYLVIKQRVQDLQLPITIVGMPIIREPEGLALSSRNQYLSAEERQEALVLSRSLRKIAEIIDGSKANLDRAQKFIQDTLLDSRWNYLEIRDAETLSTELKSSKRVTILAVYQLRTTRLLDNWQVDLG